MSEEKKAPEFLERATQAVTRPMAVPLNEFVEKRELYCHRVDEELDETTRLKSLMDSLAVEGLQTPVEFFRDSDGKPVLTKGHRRITAMRGLAKQNTPGFTTDMPVEAIEVLKATPQDLLCRSVADNSVRNGYSLMERIRAAKTLHEGGVEHNRAAYALGYSPKQFSRDLRIAQHDWMLLHVAQDEIGATQASDLLEAAEKANRVEDLRDHFKKWIDSKKYEMERELFFKGKAGKEKKLKSELTTALSDHWIDLLRRNLPLNDTLTAKSEGVIGIDADTNKVTFKETEIDLMKVNLTDLAKAVATVGTAQKVMMGFLKKRFALKDFAAQEGQQLDLTALRSEGLDEFADALSEEKREEATPGAAEEETA